jgi:hypothetical protein
MEIVLENTNTFEINGAPVTFETLWFTNKVLGLRMVISSCPAWDHTKYALVEGDGRLSEIDGSDNEHFKTHMRVDIEKVPT